MMMFEKALEDAVLLEWETTAELEEQNYYGLKEQIIQANFLDPRHVRCHFPKKQYLVIGRIEESSEYEEQLEQLKQIRQAGYICEDNIKLYIYDLFRQGYIGAGFYIVRFSSDRLPREGSHP